MDNPSDSVVELRPIQKMDRDTLFELMRDPVSVRMAAFTAEDPDDRQAFDEHLTRVLARPDTINRAVLCDGRLVGSVASFLMEGEREVTYWIDRAVWGRGIASRALGLLLDLDPERPLYARAASDNAGSLRVLEKAGFRTIGTDKGYAAGRGGEIEETILRLE